MNSGSVLGALAITISLLAVILGGYALLEETEGPQGIQGLVGIDGIDGTDGTNGANGTDGTDGTDGTNGATGPQGSTGTAGSQGPAGEDGTDLEPNEAPVIVSHTMDSTQDTICYEDDWLFCIEVEDAEDDLMKIEGYLKLNTSWFPGGYLTYLFGDHIWIPICNEVGHSGEYCFNATNIRDAIESEFGYVAVCQDITWRLDIMDGENFISEEYMFTPCFCCP